MMRTHHLRQLRNIHFRTGGTPERDAVHQRHRCGPGLPRVAAAAIGLTIGADRAAR